MHYLLPWGILECSVYIPPTPGGSDIVQIKIYWPDCLTNGTKLYQSRIDEGTMLEEYPVVIGYNQELNTGGYKSSVADVPMSTLTLKLPEKLIQTNKKSTILCPKIQREV